MSELSSLFLLQKNSFFLVQWNACAGRENNQLCNTLHCTDILHCTALLCTVVYCTALHCTALHYNILQWTVLQWAAFSCNVLKFLTVLLMLHLREIDEGNFLGKTLIECPEMRAVQDMDQIKLVILKWNYARNNTLVWKQNRLGYALG